MAAAELGERGERGIVTPEGVVLDFEIAGAASRGLAMLVDLTLLVFGLAAVANLAGLALVRLSATVAVVVVLVMLFLLLFGYPVVLETINRGRTVGKMALGLRVITVEGAPVRFRHSAIRSMLQIVDFFLTVGGAAVVSALLSERGQRIGDLVAGTIVVRERRSSATMAERAVVFQAPPGSEALVAGMDPSPLTREQSALVRSFLLRVLDLDPGARAAIAPRLAQKVADSLGQPVPPGVHP
ncbi:MAG: RDD family protein, partial [Acidimicrobiales bacterium]